VSKLLVEVCKILAIEKHPNADKLDIATIKGWNCIVGKDEFKTGDLILFCPIDSVMPENLIEKLKLAYLKNGGRVRTTKLRGYISQGLVINPVSLGLKDIKEGQDYAEKLGIIKWEEPEAQYGSNSTKKETIKDYFIELINRKITIRRFVAKSFGLVKDFFKPKKKLNGNFDKYTEIENVKNYNVVFQDGDEVIITEKVHGTNSRYGLLPVEYKGFFGDVKKFIYKILKKPDYEFCYGSHNVQKSWFKNKGGFYSSDVYKEIAEKYNLDKIIPKDIILYGEIYGKKIQDLEYGMEGIDIRFFDAKKNGKYLDWADFYALTIELNLPIVPVLYQNEFNNDILKQCTNGNSMICPNQLREGCVVKPLKETINPCIGRKILKSVSEDYLLRKNATEYK
jgi:tRNA-binding EMAP/Myf-like protein